MYHKAEFFGRALSSKEAKLKKKDANTAGLQLADQLAHPVRQKILFENGRLPGPPGLFGSKIARAIETKYNRHLYSGNVEGYGKVLFPK